MNKAILDSIGANVTKTRCGIWQTLANKLRRSGDQPGLKGGGKGGKDKKRPAGRDWEWELARSGGGSKGEGKDKTKDKGKKGRDLSFALEAFRGKTKFCLAHKNKICNDKHIGGCTRPDCRFCHACCPEPGCRIPVSDKHGLWSP